ncbi:unnamed protein product [Rangifer tarandus platyrhynchus]|uniref:Uncharacterized protein n=1 Tax=Rangifer tarandus platyrhynchus TaxID=3082113 RepID=A0AC59Y3Z5_RANTA
MLLSRLFLAPSSLRDLGPLRTNYFGGLLRAGFGVTQYGGDESPTPQSKQREAFPGGPQPAAGAATADRGLPQAQPWAPAPGAQAEGPGHTGKSRSGQKAPAGTEAVPPG